jgi:putative DNA primase/helicase
VQKVRSPKVGPAKRKWRIKKNGSGQAWVFVAEYIYKQTDGAPYLRVRKYNDENGGKQFPQAHWDGAQWQKGKPQGPKVPYRLPELIASAVSTPAYLTEGEKDADALAKLGFVATTASEGAQTAWDAALSQWFKDRQVIIIPDADRVGRSHAQKVARALDGVAASIKVVDLYPERSDGSDVSNWLETDRVGVKLVQICSSAPAWEPTPIEGSREPDELDEELIAELAALPKLRYQKRRVEIAKRFGIRVSELDKLVAEARGEIRKKEPSPALYDHWVVEPAEEEIDGAALLEELTTFLKTHLVISEHQAIVVGLWVLFTWTHDVAVHSPLLLITSPQANSGKSTLLGLINFLVRRSVQSVSISGPALFRSIEKWVPTFIVDEADTVLANNEDLKEVVNSGWTRGQAVIRCHAVTLEPQPYSTFAPKAIGMKGRKLPDTTLSRAIIIAMKRKLPAEEVVDFDHTDNETLARLRRQLLRWATDNSEALAQAEPQIPEGFHNRTRANWKPILAIAERIGGGWKALARKAAVEIEDVHETFDPSIGIQLLADIKEAFTALGTDRATSATLITGLVKEPEKPWATYNKGKPLSQRQLAGLLKDFEIYPRTVRTTDERGKGYLLPSLADAFARYLPAETFNSSVTTGQGNEFNRLEEKTIRDTTPMSRMQNEPNVLKTNDCHGGTDKNPISSDEGDIAGAIRPPDARICAQCRGSSDGSEELVETDAGRVWLHRECRWFYRNGGAPW